MPEDLFALASQYHQALPDRIRRYVALRPSSANFRGRCPFHEDHQPSLMVYPATGTFHCFGCGRHGDVITFVVAMERLPFLHALDWLERFQNDHERGTPQAA